MKKIVSLALAVALVFGMGVSHLRAAETKPIAALAVASYDDLVSDVNFVGKLVDRPQLGAGLEGLLAMVTQGKGLAGVDKSRTCGVIVQASDENNVTAYAFVPVTDFKEALDLLKLYFTVDSQGDVQKLTPKDGKKPAYVKQQGDWALFADKPEVLAQAGDHPAALLGNLKKEYIVAGRLFLANVPEGLRKKFWGQINQGLQKDAAQHENESNEAYANRKKVVEQLQSYAHRVCGDLDQIVFGWGLDRTAGNTFVDVSVTAKADTETAIEMDLAAKASTNLAGFRATGAALSYAWAGIMPAAKQQIAASVIEALRDKALADIEKKQPEEKRAVIKEVFNDGADLLQKIVKSGRADGAVSVLLAPDAATGLMAGYVADGELLDKMLHTIAKAAIKDHPEVEQFITFDAEKLGAVRFHKISIPLPPDTQNREQAVKLIGETIDIVIGVGKENAYVAAGRDAAAKLKKAIDESHEIGAKTVLPVEISIAGRPIAGFVAALGKPNDRPKAERVATELEKTEGKDHILLTVKPISNGIRMRLEVEEGLLRLVGAIGFGGASM